MGEFTADWLTLRETVDARSRNQTLTRKLQTWRQNHATLTVLDLGTGTGSNVRFLLPRLKGTQRWILVDSDSVLLDALESRMTHWAKAQNLSAHRKGSILRLQSDHGDASLETRQLDLAEDLNTLDWQNVDLITASALLDLVSPSWLDQFVQHCHDASATVFLPLTYDGFIHWQPEDPDDGLIRDSVNTHQRNDKGFGPALGPAAVGYAVDCLQRIGYRVFTGRSDWHLDYHDQAIQAALLNDYGKAAMQQGRSTSRVNAWLTRRHERPNQPVNKLTVGHVDIFALI